MAKRSSTAWMNNRQYHTLRGGTVVEVAETQHGIVLLQEEEPPTSVRTQVNWTLEDALEVAALMTKVARKAQRRQERAARRAERAAEVA